ncbi:MAG TPA: spore germination protein, partial [Bacillota bacterium]
MNRWERRDTDPLGPSKVELSNLLLEYERRIERLGSIKERARRLQLLLTATEALEDLPLSDMLSLNVRTFTHLFDGSSDWIVRSFRIAGGRDAVVMYFDGLTDAKRIDAFVVRPLMYEAFPIRSAVDHEQVRHLLQRHAVALSQIRTVGSVREVADCLLHGDAALLLDGDATALVLSARQFDKRQVSEPETEAVIRGPREGFVEDLRTNTALLRRRIRTPELKLENVRVGRLSRSDVVIAYIRGIAPDVIVREVMRRVSRIRIDGIISDSYIEELIEDDPYSPFPQVLSTERPDTVAANLLEGRVAILVDGSPFVLVAPVTLWSMMQASE